MSPKQLYMLFSIQNFICLAENYSYLSPHQLVPKIPCVFLPNFVVSDIVDKYNFQNSKYENLRKQP